MKGRISPSMAIACLALFFSLAASAQAAQTITVVNDAHVRPAVLHRVEHAIGRQSWELAYWWHTQPIRFGPGGWKIYLRSSIAGAPNDGYHCPAVAADAPPQVCPGMRAPDAIVATDGLAWDRLPRGEAWPRDAADGWTVALSHEVDEMLVDPSSARVVSDDRLLEIDDPVGSSAYRIDGVYVSDFTHPAWWFGGSGPYDEMGTVPVPEGPIAVPDVGSR